MNDNEGLVYIGKIISLEQIPDADNIISATVVCGKGGKWRGVVRKSESDIGLLVTVYLPDALITEAYAKEYGMEFLKSSHYRVKMRRFKGAPSEVVIMPLQIATGEIGFDCTEMLGVTKYHKPIPANLACDAKGNFPGFIPKTDELNYQRHEDLVDQLHGKPYYITEKADGSSTTAYRFKGEFGLCSRNWELKRNPDNGYWKVAIKYKLEENLPEGYALQWETCGPKIQGNPMGLHDVDGFAFSAYKIDEHRYLEMTEFWSLLGQLKMPICPFVQLGGAFDKKGIELLGEGKYKNGKEREGVVVRSQENFGNAPISFKVINLNYEK